jgi:hypothetical protein
MRRCRRKEAAIMAAKFVVTKRFTDGALKGITIRETTGVEFRVGDVITPGVTGAGYVVEAVERVA